jgi:predicted enzyme related to lactoylglutathione lyase
MVPKQPLADSDGPPFIAITSLCHLTMFVTDQDAVGERCIARGGSVVVEPFELEPDSRLAILHDPDGNTMEVVETGNTSRTSRKVHR